MSAMLSFNDGGWDVLTAAWSAAATPEAQITTICYQWGADGFSLISSATGISRIYVTLSMPEFAKLVAAVGVVDLRKYQQD
jgi:hypothetical protein